MLMWLSMDGQAVDFVSIRRADPKNLNNKFWLSVYCTVKLISDFRLHDLRFPNRFDILDLLSNQYKLIYFKILKSTIYSEIGGHVIGNENLNKSNKIA